jgi:hypothetical protein
MNRSISRDLTASRAMALGEAALQPKLSASGRETLVFSCQVLQHLMGSDDKSLIMAEKVESWLPVAAELFGKNQGAAENWFKSRLRLSVLLQAERLALCFEVR